MGRMTCPICGGKFPYDVVEYLDNGNPACPNCVNEKRKRMELEEEKPNSQ